MNTTVGTDIAQAKFFLDKGDVIAIATETVYGLAANALNEEAVKKIYMLKQRPLHNPLIVHTHSIKKILDYVTTIHPALLALMEKFCPGPITFLLPKKNIIPHITTANSNLVGIRIPHHPLTLQLLQQLDYPLAAPSANVYQYISPTQPLHVLKQFENKIPYILDGGNCNVGIESTIIGINDKEEIVIYRLGHITQSQIEHTIKNKVIVNIKQNPKNITPGSDKLHYAPKTKMLCFENLENIIHAYQHLKIGLITTSQSFTTQYPYITKEIILTNSIDNLTQASQNLYDALFTLDHLNLDVILVQQFPPTEIGNALNDRILRGQYVIKQKLF